MREHDHAEQQRSGQKYSILAGLIRVLGELEQFELGNEQEIDAWIDKHENWSCQRLQQEIIDLLYPLKPVFKSTRLPLSPQALATAIASLKNTYFVHLVRHPNDVIASLSKLHPQTCQIGKLNLHAQTWIHANKNIASALSHLPKKFTGQLRAESLLTNPVQEFSEILASAGHSTDIRELQRVLKPELSTYALPCPFNPEFYMDSGFICRPKLACSERKSRTLSPFPEPLSDWQKRNLTLLSKTYRYDR